MWQILAERAEHAGAIGALAKACFGAGRFAKTAYRLREGVNPVTGLGFVAISDKDGALLGSVRYWPIDIGGHPSLLLGPLAVQPKLRGQGIGLSLMQRGNEEARRRGFESVVLIGDEPYYAKVGFTGIPAGQIIFPGPVDPTRILGISLRPGALLSLSGQVRPTRVNVPGAAPAVDSA